MAKSNWEIAKIIAIVIGIITLLWIGTVTYLCCRKLDFSPSGASIFALLMVAFLFGIFYGIYCLIRWIELIGSKHVSEIKGDKCRICDKKIGEAEKAYVEDGELLCVDCERKTAKSQDNQKQ